MLTQRSAADNVALSSMFLASPYFLCSLPLNSGVVFGVTGTLDHGATIELALQCVQYATPGYQCQP